MHMVLAVQMCQLIVLQANPYSSVEIDQARSRWEQSQSGTDSRAIDGAVYLGCKYLTSPKVQ